MEKELKRSIGDVVWVMHDDHIVQGYICDLWYSKFLDMVDYETIQECEGYSVFDEGSNMIGNYSSDEAFDSKEELINSL